MSSANLTDRTSRAALRSAIPRAAALAGAVALLFTVFALFGGQRMVVAALDRFEQQRLWEVPAEALLVDPGERRDLSRQDPAASRHSLAAQLERIETLNPGVHAFVLDSNGRVQLHTGTTPADRFHPVDLRPIERALADEAPPMPIFGSTPYSSQQAVIFSVAELPGKDGYLYVVSDVSTRLGKAIFDLTVESASAGFVLIIVFGGLLAAGFLIRYSRVIRLTASVLHEYREGRYHLSFPKTADDELAAVGRALSTAAADAVRAKTALAEANERRAALLARVVHDARIPLTALRAGYESLLDPRIRLHEERSGRILTALNGALSSLGGLRTHFQVLRDGLGGKESLQRRDVPLDALIRAVVAQLEPRAAQRGISLQCDAENVPLNLPIDQVRIERVLSNLIQNAIQHTGEGGHISVRLRRDPLTARCDVIDSGTGIAVEDLPHVFEPRYRGKHTTSDGHGLGLASVRTLVEQHGGSLDVASEPGRGSTFHFSLPLLPQDAPEHDSPRQTLPETPSAPHAPSNSSLPQAFWWISSGAAAAASLTLGMLGERSSIPLTVAGAGAFAALVAELSRTKSPPPAPSLVLRLAATLLLGAAVLFWIPRLQSSLVVGWMTVAGLLVGDTFHRATARSERLFHFVAPLAAGYLWFVRSEHVELPPLFYCGGFIWRAWIFQRLWLRSNVRMLPKFALAYFGYLVAVSLLVVYSLYAATVQAFVLAPALWPEESRRTLANAVLTELNAVAGEQEQAQKLVRLGRLNPGIGIALYRPESATWLTTAVHGTPTSAPPHDPATGPADASGWSSGPARSPWDERQTIERWRLAPLPGHPELWLYPQSPLTVVLLRVALQREAILFGLLLLTGSAALAAGLVTLTSRPWRRFLNEVREAAALFSQTPFTEHNLVSRNSLYRLAAELHHEIAASVEALAASDAETAGLIAGSEAELLSLEQRLRPQLSLLTASDDEAAINASLTLVTVTERLLSALLDLHRPADTGVGSDNHTDPLRECLDELTPVTAVLGLQFSPPGTADLRELSAVQYTALYSLLAGMIDVAGPGGTLSIESTTGAAFTALKLAASAADQSSHRLPLGIQLAEHFVQLPAVGGQLSLFVRHRPNGSLTAELGIHTARQNPTR